MLTFLIFTGGAWADTRTVNSDDDFLPGHANWDCNDSTWTLREAIQCSRSTQTASLSVYFNNNYTIDLLDFIDVPSKTAIIGTNSSSVNKRIQINNYGFLLGTDEDEVYDIEIGKITFDHMNNYKQSPQISDWYGYAIIISHVRQGSQYLSSPAMIDIHHNTFKMAKGTNFQPMGDITAILVVIEDDHPYVEDIVIRANAFQEKYGDEPDSSRGIVIVDDSQDVEEFHNVTVDVHNNCFWKLDKASLEVAHGRHVLSYNNVFHSWNWYGAQAYNYGEIYSHRDMFDFDDIDHYLGLKTNATGYTNVDGSVITYCPDGYTRVTNGDNDLCAEGDYCCENDSDPDEVYTVIDENSPGSCFDPDDYSYSYSTFAPSWILRQAVCNNAGNPSD